MRDCIIRVSLDFRKRMLTIFRIHGAHALIFIFENTDTHTHEWKLKISMIEYENHFYVCWTHTWYLLNYYDYYRIRIHWNSAQARQSIRWRRIRWRRRRNGYNWIHWKFGIKMKKPKNVSVHCLFGYNICTNRKLSIAGDGKLMIAIGTEFES